MATINGTPGPDNLQGTSTGDVIHGLAGEDTIFGADGDDRIFGDEGNDKIDLGGGIDMDIATGGPDRDEFIVNSGFGSDTITDYNHQEDHISFAEGAGKWLFDGQDTTIFHPTGSLTLSNFDLTPYAGDFPSFIPLL